MENLEQLVKNDSRVPAAENGQKTESKEYVLVPRQYWDQLKELANPNIYAHSPGMIFKLKNLEKALEYIGFEDGRLVVNWKGLEEYAHQDSTIYGNALDLLESAGILSRDKKGNYGLVSGNTEIVPSKTEGKYYFRHPSDVRAYQAAKPSLEGYRMQRY